MNIYKSFVYMFYALDAIYDENPNDELGNYLSGLNPFLFDDEGSADPAEYEEFKEAYAEQFGDKEPTTSEIYEFCRGYLSIFHNLQILQKCFVCLFLYIQYGTIRFG